jgi:hypothetical protein
MALGKLSGKALRYLFSTPGAVKGAPEKLMTAGELAFRLLPDIGFASPGDIFDKSAVAGTQLLGGTGLGLLAGRLGGRNQLAAGLLDQVGSIAGDYASMPVADALMRGKDKIAGGKGQTPYERLNEEQQMMLAEQVKNQVLSAYGILPGTRNEYFSDPSTGMGVA